MATRSSGEHWPEELVNEILLRLPVKSILRFKSVAKTWYHLFKTPTFISQHHSLSKRNTRLLVRYLWMNVLDDETLDEDDLPPQLPHCIANEDGVLDEEDGFCVDNGLVCLWDRTKYEISLWNPATREFRVLPRCHRLQEIDRFYLGFGFDPMSNDYKVVCIIKGNVLTPQIICCAVYKMSTDAWRVMNEEEVQILSNISCCWSASTGTCVNGVCYWLVPRRRTRPSLKKLLAFHLGHETFQLIQLPPGKRNGQLLISSHNDNICFACTHKLHKGYELGPLLVSSMSVDSDPYTDTGYEIWMLNYEDEGQYWTKLLTIEYSPFIFGKIFRVWGKSKLLGYDHIDENLLLWDLETNKSIGIDNFADEDLLQVCPYHESLVGTSKC